MPDYYVKVEGIEKILEALDKFPRSIAKYLGNAGKESADRVVLDTTGLKKYPPFTSANLPPEPYYIRGRGMQTKKGNLGGSQRLGTQWYTKVGLSSYTTEIGNRASYAQYVVGEDQAKHMGAQARIPKGWRILKEVVTEKMPQITKVYQAWVDKLIKDLGL